MEKGDIRINRTILKEKKIRTSTGWLKLAMMKEERDNLKGGKQRETKGVKVKKTRCKLTHCPCPRSEQDTMTRKASTGQYSSAGTMGK